MQDQFYTYLDMILTQREWSWSIAAIVFIVLGLGFRSAFIDPLIQKAKTLSRKDYSDFRNHYLRLSYWGWACFIFSIVLATWLWKKPLKFPLTFSEVLIVIFTGVSYFLGLAYHLRAIGIAAMSVMLRLRDTD